MNRPKFANHFLLVRITVDVSGLKTPVSFNGEMDNSFFFAAAKKYPSIVALAS
jgi:hypothetical protein